MHRFVNGKAILENVGWKQLHADLQHFNVRGDWSSSAKSTWLHDMAVASRVVEGRWDDVVKFVVSEFVANHAADAYYELAADQLEQDDLHRSERVHVERNVTLDANQTSVLVLLEGVGCSQVQRDFLEFLTIGSWSNDARTLWVDAALKLLNVNDPSRRCAESFMKVLNVFMERALITFHERSLIIDAARQNFPYPHSSSAGSADSHERCVF